MDSITDLAPSLIQFGGLSQYRDLVSVLKNAGYITGLNLQALPYDWRISYTENSLNTLFAQTMKRLWEKTGKKVVIVAHSFGNMQVAHNLWKMPQADKDQYIARYIALAPPYLGSAQLVAGTIGYDSRYSYHVAMMNLGVTTQMYKDAIADQRGFFNLMNKKAVATNSNTNWW
jgi:pimeloyl-ACP methyl ester carboxylesterase